LKTIEDACWSLGFSLVLTIRAYGKGHFLRYALLCILIKIEAELLSNLNRNQIEDLSVCKDRNMSIQVFTKCSYPEN